jgi:hypothetical protein
MSALRGACCMQQDWQPSWLLLRNPRGRTVSNELAAPNPLILNTVQQQAGQR